MTICAILTLEFLLTSYISSTAAIRAQLCQIHSAFLEGLNNDLWCFLDFIRWLLKSSLSSLMDVDSTHDRHKLKEFHCWSWVCTSCATASCPSAVLNKGTDWLTICFILLPCQNGASAVSFYYFTTFHHWCYCPVLWICANGVGLFSNSSQKREQIIHFRL